MESLERRMRALFDDRLVCSVEHLQYDFAQRRGRLYLPRDCCCDMSGAIALFVGIDPKVRRIETFADLVADTVYVRSAGRWTATRP